MNLASQFERQLEQAEMLVRTGVYKGPLFVTAVSYDGMLSRISIVGGTISTAMLEIWRMQGARVNVLDVVH